MSTGQLRVTLPPIDSLQTPLRRSAGEATVASSLGGLAALVSFFGSWNPSFWGDEAASVMSAERPLSTLWAEISHVDAVHATYYVFLHFWIQLFGASEFSTRLPSAIAIGIAAAGIYLLSTRLFDRKIAIVAVALFAVLPRVTFMGMEARSYAAGTALAVWLTILFLGLLRRREVRRWPWVLYGLVLALAMYIFLYFALFAVVHAVAVFGTADGRAVRRQWLRGIGIAFVSAIPIIVFGAAQHGQVAFLATRNADSFRSVFVTQWFGSPALAAASWLLLAAAVWFAIRRRSTPMFHILLWALLPMALLLVVDKTVIHDYTARYLSFTTPAVAIAMAFGVWSLSHAIVARLRGNQTAWLITVAAVLSLTFVGLATPTYLHQRTAYGKDGGSDLRQTAEFVQTHARPGDTVVFDQQIRNARKPRLGAHLYPFAYVGLRDPTLSVPYQDSPGIWDATVPIFDVADKFTTATTVWAIELTPKLDGGRIVNADLVQLHQLGFTIVSTHRIHRTVVYELLKENS